MSYLGETVVVVNPCRYCGTDVIRVVKVTCEKISRRAKPICNKCANAKSCAASRRKTLARSDTEVLRARARAARIFRHVVAKTATEFAGSVRSVREPAPTLRCHCGALALGYLKSRSGRLTPFCRKHRADVVNIPA